MPRVIQAGGGSGKMRDTTRRRRGLVAAYKRMQAEGMFVLSGRASFGYSILASEEKASEK